jgi:hypothetical protein
MIEESPSCFVTPLGVLQSGLLFLFPRMWAIYLEEKMWVGRATAVLGNGCQRANHNAH